MELAKQIKQFRYYGKNYNTQDYNYPSNNFYGEGKNYNITKNPLVMGTLFDDINNISALGIQAKPGTMFYLNDNYTDGDYPIIIGETGIFEIDLQDLGTINKIRFKQASINHYDNPSDPSNPDRLLIDIIYEGGKSQ